MNSTINHFPETIYNIADFGARVSDSYQTEAIQKAIDTCFLNGGGRVVIPEGIFLTGGLRLRSNVVLYLESGAILKGSRDPEDYYAYKNDEIEPIEEYENNENASVYPYSRWNNAVIRVLNAKNVAIIGEKGSYIDGRNCYDAIGEEDYRGPHAISVWRCRGLTLRGYTIIDSANWAHAIFDSQDITVQNVTVYGGHDGIDVRTCDRVRIEDCVLHTGDDCVAGFDNHDVIVRRCDLQSSCSLFRFGGNGVLIEECRSSLPGFGFRGSIPKARRQFSPLTDETARHISHNPFLYYCDFRAEIRKTPGDILVRNCRFDGVRRLFRLEFDGQHKWCCNRSLSSITFRDCEFLNLDAEGILYGDQKEPVTFRLHNCRITKKEGAEDFPLLICTNFDLVEMESVRIEGFDAPKLVLQTPGALRLETSTPITVEREDIRA